MHGRAADDGRRGHGWDVVFGTKQELVVPFQRHDGGATPVGDELDRPWVEARYDFVLQPAD